MTNAMFPIVTLLLLLGGCTVGTTYERPAVAMPDRWLAGAADSGAGVPAAWWTQFNSKELDQLIAGSVENNHDLKAAASRIAQARAVARVVGAGRLPQVTVGGAASRARDSGDERATSALELVLGSSFDVDLWGRNRHAHEAALGRVQGSVFARHFVRTALQADVATAYIRYLSANDRVALARRTLHNAESLLRLFEAQFRAGAISGLEVERQLALAAGVRADIPPIEVERTSARNALAILLGRPPQQFSVTAQSLTSLSLPAVAAGLPAALLVRRSDIRLAEAELAAAHADVNAARAAFFPGLRLTASGGVAGATVQNLLRAGNPVYGVAAGLVAPVFNHGRLQGEQDLAEARQTELLQSYHQTILKALREVEDVLTAGERLAEQYRQQQRLMVHAEAALHMVELRHRNGAIDFTAVLDAQRVLFAARTALEEVRQSRYLTVVELYRALGGGWQDAQPMPNAMSANGPAQ